MLMIGFLVISFVAGALTILAPCILPVLPIIIGGAATEGKNYRRAWVIVISLGASVFLFTLILKVSTAFIVIPALFWQIVSGGLLLFFGLTNIFPLLWDRIPIVNIIYRRSNLLLGKGYQKQTIWGDATIGAALGPVFSSCSPTYFVILAAVLPAHFAIGLLYLLSYIAGLCLFLLVITLVGQRLVGWLGLASDPHGWFKKIIGILFIIVGIAVLSGLDKKLQVSLPAGAFKEIQIEQRLLSGPQSAPVSPATTPQESVAAQTAPRFLTMSEKATRYKKAPELAAPNGYINTDGKPITLKELIGKKVVLIDFWTYSCINCQRTIPYRNAWYEKYKDQGCVIIGVHTPEFAFEHVLSNVETATKNFGIRYPVALDNEYRTWQAFDNKFWPREYLIDIDGYIIYDHAGEGEYDATERAIQQALRERAARLGGGSITESVVNMPIPNLTNIRSPEIYFGALRNEYLANGMPGQQGIQNFTLPDAIEPNSLYLGGIWNIMPEYIESQDNSSILFRYSSNDIYMVARAKTSARIKIYRDGKPVGNFAGADVDPNTSEAHIQEDRLYKLIHDTTPGVHTIRIQVEEGTLYAYTFTFG